MSRPTPVTPRHPGRRTAFVSRDRGMTLVEILISITLMSLVVGGVLAAVRVTVVATAVDRDHANAHAWLQTAADVLYARELVQCTPIDGAATNIDDIISAYEATIQETENPEHWPASNISIFDLQLWHVDFDPVTKLTEEGWGDACDAADTNLQRVGIEVRSPNDDVVERVEVIIGE
jgi:prepilin-type N-terminal cleavage/methylation domain-containing protein